MNTARFIRPLFWTLLVLLTGWCGRSQTAGWMDQGFDTVYTPNWPVTAYAVQPDGKMVVGGWYSAVRSELRDRLARLNPDGTLDSSFHAWVKGGSSVRAVAIQADGKILVGGYFTKVNGQPVQNLARLLADGRLDETFQPDVDGTVSAVAIQPDGKILITGFFNQVRGANRKGIARLLPTGALDHSFDAGREFESYAIALQQDGKILASGWKKTDPYTFVDDVYRLYPDGSLDESFTPSVDDQVEVILVQSNQEIVIGGSFTRVNGASRNHIARLHPDGSLDTGFDPDANNGVKALALQADGKILMGGSFTQVGGEARHRITRLLADGSPDTDFEGSTTGRVDGISIHSDGKIWLAQWNSPYMSRLWNAPPVSELTVSQTDAILWTRSGSSPEVGGVTFEYWNGTAWVAAGAPARILDGWVLDGLNLPQSSWIRARGRTVGAAYGGSSGLVEEIIRYGDDPVPELSVMLEGVELELGNGRMDFGEVDWMQTSSPMTLTLANTGGAVLDNIGVAISGAHPLDFSVQNPSLTSLPPGGSLTLDIDFTPGGGGLRGAVLRIVNGDPSRAPFEVELTGRGIHREDVLPDTLLNEVHVITLDKTGGLLVGGTFSYVEEERRDNLFRLFTDGSLDPFFNPGTDGMVSSITVQRGGGTLIAGDFSEVGGEPRPFVARILPDGTLDPDFNPSPNRLVRCIATQSDGKILLGGDFSSIAGQSSGSLVRLHPDGSLDTEFDPGVSGAVHVIHIQPDGDILIAGNFSSVHGEPRGRVARLKVYEDSEQPPPDDPSYPLVDGALDENFLPDPDAVFPKILAMTVQPDGKILLGSSSNFTLQGNRRGRLVRLHPDGLMDAAFHPDADGTVNTIALQSNGDILIGGAFTTVSGGLRRGLARLKPNGDLDPRFDPVVNNQVNTLMLEADGKIWVGGNFTALNGEYSEQRIARLPNDAATSQVQYSLYDGFEWILGGSAPEYEQVTFDVWDQGQWTSLPSSSRVVGGWRAFPYSSPPANGWVRARGSLSGGGNNGSQGVVQVIEPYGVGTSPELGLHVNGVPVSESTRVLEFDTLEWREGAATVELTLTNTGDAELGGFSADLSGANASDFEVVGLPSGTLAPGESAIVTLRFQSDAIGDRWAVLSLESSDAGQFPVEFYLSGRRIHSPSAFNVTNNQRVYAVALQPDGALVLGGQFTNLAGQTRLRLARLTARGELDPAFVAEADGEVTGLAVQSDGRILVEGAFNHINGVPRYEIARLWPDGALDQTFAPEVNGRIWTFALQSNGQIVIGGEFTEVNGIVRERIARLNPDGSLDMGFHPSVNNLVLAVYIQSNGDILVSGNFSTVEGQPRSRLARLKPDGSLDTAFDPAPSSSFYAMAQQPDGKLLLSGSFTTIGGVSVNRVARLELNGAVDTSFQASANSTVSALALQADGSLHLGGSFTEINGTPRSYLARLESDGSLDPDFNPGGDSRVYDLVLGADGDLFAAGWFSRLGDEYHRYLNRLANDPASSSLSVDGGGVVIWQQGGTAPVFDQVLFERWDGQNWISMGPPERNATGWNSTGDPLVQDGWVRASGFRQDGTGSSSLIQEFLYHGGTGYPELEVSVGGEVQTSGLSFFDFGTVDWKQRSAPAVVTLTNTGTALLEDLSVRIIGPHAYHFAGKPLPATSLAPGEDLTLELRFIPLEAGSLAAWFEIVAGDPGRLPFRMLLRGEGVQGDTSYTVFDADEYAFTQHILALGNGQLLLGGSFRDSQNDNQRFLVKVNADGALDETFSPEFSSGISAMARQSDGRILVGGTFTSVRQTLKPYLARLLPDGQLDDSFPASVNGEVESIALQANGDILLGGSFTRVNGLPRNRLARVDANGVLDMTFDPDVANGNVECILVLDDGSLLMGGSFTQVGGLTRNRLARILPDGTVDPAFDPDVNGTVRTLSVQEDGAILLAGGFTSVGGESRNRIARIFADGTLDASFAPSADHWVHTLHLNADGTILLGGAFSTINGIDRQYVARLYSNGTLDATFNPGADGNVSVFHAVSGDQILAGGQFSSFGGQVFEGITRLDTNTGEAIIAVTGENSQLIASGERPSSAKGTDLGSTPTGTSTDQTFTVRNPGTTPLVISSTTLEGIHADDFQILSAPSNLQGGGSGILSLRFSPSMKGLREAVVVLNSDDPTRPQFRLPVRGEDLGYPPSILVNQGDQTVVDGQTATFSISMEGTPPFSVQWFAGESGDDSNPLPGETGLNYTTPALATGDYPYWARVSNAAGTAETMTLTATVRPLPEFEGLQAVQATVGELFTLQLTATESPTSFRLLDPPDWMNIATDTGKIYGVPDATGLHTVRTAVSNAYFLDVEGSFELQVFNAPPILTGLDSLPNARVGQPFAFQVTVIGENLSFSVTGLPAGLTFNTVNQRISGIPVSEGTFPVEFSVTNDGGNTLRTVDLEVLPAYQPPRITSPGSVNVGSGAPLSFTFTATDDPDTFELEATPAWLSLDSAMGALTGATAPLPGTEVLRVRAIGPGGTGEWTDFQIQIPPHPDAPVINSLALAYGRVSEPFNYQLEADSEMEPVSWNASELPPGLSLDLSTGALSGTPTLKGEYSVEVRAFNSAGVSQSQMLTLEILRKLNVPVLQSDPTLEATVGEPFSFTFTATNVPDAFVFTGLPDWLSQVGSTGQVSGTPTLTGTDELQVMAVNTDGESRHLAVRISSRVAAGAPLLLDVTRRSGYVGRSFSAELVTDPAADSFITEGLPPGLTVYPDEGVLGGIPTESGTYRVRFTPSNAEGSGETVEFEFTFDPLPEAPRVQTLRLPPGRILEFYEVFILAEGETISSYQAEGIPSGMEFDPSIGRLHGTPRAFGRFRLTFSASNIAGKGDPVELEWIVRPVDQAPKIMGEAFVVTQQGQEMSYAFSAEPMPIVSYKAVGLPEGISLDAEQGVLRGKPVYPGTYPVTLTAVNLYGESEPLELSFIVEPAPLAPRILTQGFVRFGQPFEESRLLLSATNFPVSPYPAGYRFEAKSLSHGLDLNPATGELYGRLGEGQYTVQVRARTPERVGSWHSIILEVRPAANPRTITGPDLVTVNLWEPAVIQPTGNLDGMNYFEYFSPIRGRFYSARSGIARFTPAAYFVLPGSNALTVRGAVMQRRRHCSWYSCYTYTRVGSFSQHFPFIMQVNLSPDTPRISIPDSFSGTPDELPVISAQSPEPLRRLWVWYKRPGSAYFHHSRYGGPGFRFHEQPGVYDAIVYGEKADGTKTEPKLTTITIANTATSVTVTELVPGVDTGIAAAVAKAPGTRSSASTKEPKNDPAPTLEVQVGVAFNALLNLSGGAERVEVEGLPEGLSVNPLAFSLGGVPQEPGVFLLTFTVWTEDGVPGVSYLDLIVDPAEGTPEFNGTNPPVARAGELWSWTPTFTPAETAMVLQDAPAWVELDDVTGTLSGTPVLPGEESLVIQPLNDSGWGRRLEWTLAVQPSALAQNTIEPDKLQLVGGRNASHDAPVDSFGTWLELDGRVPGLVWDPETGTFSGTPDGKGAYNLRLRAWNEHGPGEWADWDLEVLESARDALARYLADAGLSGGDADPFAAPHGDGVPNLLKFAHNLDASGFDQHRLVPGSGFSGLPVIGREAGIIGQNFHLEYIRRRYSTLDYNVQTTSGLLDPEWLGVQGTETVTPLDADWERVRLRPNQEGVEVLFLRVGVSSP